MTVFTLNLQKLILSFDDGPKDLKVIKKQVGSKEKKKK